MARAGDAVIIITMFAVAEMFTLAGTALGRGHRYHAAILGLGGWVAFLLHNILVRRRHEQA
jgi:hypothetical protein